MLVVFTGKDSKQILNEGSYAFKQSHIDKVINIALAFNIFLVLVALGVPLTFQTYNFLKSHFHQSYLYQDSLSIKTVTARTYASFYLLNNSFIPLDLVVMIDTAKIIYTFWVECDVSIYGVSVRNMSLHEDLAQVEYLFCDKTGTLTQNELRFRGLCLRGQSIV